MDPLPLSYQLKNREANPVTGIYQNEPVEGKGGRGFGDSTGRDPGSALRLSEMSRTIKRTQGERGDQPPSAVAASAAAATSVLDFDGIEAGLRSAEMFMEMGIMSPIAAKSGGGGSARAEGGPVRADEAKSGGRVRTDVSESVTSYCLTGAAV